MKNTDNIVQAFLDEVKPTQLFWALQDKTSENWVVLDSINFEDTDVMPIWSNSTLAKLHCIDEWQEYIPAAISLSDWMEFWLEDLNEDGVIVGINWQEDECLEMELADFTQSLATIESL